MEDEELIAGMDRDLREARERISKLEASLRIVVTMFDEYTNAYGPGWGEMEDIKMAKALLAPTIANKT
jgi:ABC-type Fe3+-hydroxamate transport system substrate-binding protein